ncbi:phage tail sheath C-terminal domain-containing protein [Acaryochloris sp. IP29b_bin.148]|uniref:phage tail sheath family protein n=1 Tax=Acaryochloris sp. IP29b_bin.148 TaxID=2969218 RepID=UPI002631DC8A|nr:phage tail sheath C-terminal domain-containing protein [Acaryochloris sp. IP29b_bin.148]
MPIYKTPNVYIEEVATLPPSVVPVATAIPAFIGCTEKAGNNNEYRLMPIRISSLLDYTTHFGGAHATPFAVTLDEKEQITQIQVGDSAITTPNYLMYYAVRLFFDNGGGSCYIISVEDYSKKPNKQAFEDGLAALRKEDEPTLILLTDAVNLAGSTDYYDLCKSALRQCNDLKDRFSVLDVLATDNDATKGIGANFRGGIGTEYLKYGAAYYPYLQTSLNYHYTDDSVTITTTTAVGQLIIGGADGLLVTYSGSRSETPRARVTITARQDIDVALDNNVLTIRLPQAGGSVADILTKVAAASLGKYTVRASGATTQMFDTTLDETPLSYPPDTLADKSIKTEKTELYSKIKLALNALRVTMPPSSAIVGVYATVDRERGVWKAPANVSLASVIGPTVKVTNEEQENLNVHTTGKSINAIRGFTGKGTLIWGARTLAGNDNEWRYVSVRRFFNLIEESIQKATNFVVFESNNAITWLKVKTIAETYLDGLWRQGALAGATPEEAYFVNVGLGQTMTEQDILEGRMIIEIGVSVVRPAEFIVLRFSHKLQQT